MTADVRHILDQYLASVGQTPACVDSDGRLVFEAGEHIEAYAAMLPDGRLELFAGMGYVRAELLRAIVEADEDDDFHADLPCHAADVMVRWTGEGARWAVDVDRRMGLLTLSMFVAAIPGDPNQWAAILDAFKPPAHRGSLAFNPIRSMRCRTPVRGWQTSTPVQCCAAEHGSSRLRFHFTSDGPMPCVQLLPSI